MSFGVEANQDVCMCVCWGVSTIRRPISSELANASAVAKLSTIRKVITAITARSNQLKVFFLQSSFFPAPCRLILLMCPPPVPHPPLLRPASFYSILLQ